jgi:hypothetical protein
MLLVLFQCLGGIARFVVEISYSRRSPKTGQMQVFDARARDALFNVTFREAALSAHGVLSDIY